MDQEINLTVFSPAAGIVTALEQVPDPVFAEKMLGDGLAVNPSDNFIFAPFDGLVKTLHKSLHAVVIEQQGIEILIHIGVETVNLKGQGFKALVKQGDTVKKGDKLLEFDRDFIAKNAPSNLVIVIVANKPDAVLNKTSAVDIRPGQPLFSLGAPLEEPKAESEPKGDAIFSEVISVKNKNGFHARPASVIAKMAAAYEDTNLEIIKNNTRANAKSMVEILGLSIDYNDNIQVSASGPQDAAALKEITQAILKGLNEGVTPPLKPVTAPVYDFTKQALVHGVSVFPDLAIGKAFIMQQDDIAVEESSSDSQGEAKKLEAAANSVRASIKSEAQNSSEKNKIEILKAHLAMLEDPFLIKSAQGFIQEGKTAGFAWKAAIKKSIDVLNATGNALLKERTADFKDVEARVLLELAGVKRTAPDFPAGSIVLVKDLLSYELGFLNKNVVGVVMALGSPTSHVSIMLKNMGVACIISAGEEILKIKPGSDVILDSQKGTLTVNPDNIEEVKKQKAAKEAIREINRSHAFEPAVTKDGTVIRVEGNVGTVAEAEKAYTMGSEGLALVRTEFLFSSAKTAPTEDEQYKLYQAISDSQRGSGQQEGKSVIIRTLDVGGDKPLAYMPIAPEENPIMGLRGVRNYGVEPEIFRAQIRAIMRVKPYGIAKIMLPMVGFIDELWQYKRIIMAEQEKLGIDKVSMGIMIEVPSAAILAGEFARHVDFFSIGTNDLTQYTLAIDRGHTALSPLADSLNPAVLKLIELTVQGGAKHNKPVGVCGAMASDIAAVPVLLGLGIRDLGVVGSLIPDIKAFIRTLDMAHCRNVAALALGMQEAGQVREMIKTQFKL